MGKIQAVVCIAVLLMNILTCDANEDEIASAAATRNRPPKSGSIFGKRADFGSEESDLIPTSGNEFPAIEQRSGSRSSLLIANFCEKAYRKQMLNGAAMPAAIWVYNMEKLNAICNF